MRWGDYFANWITADACVVANVEVCVDCAVFCLTRNQKVWTVIKMFWVVAMFNAMLKTIFKHHYLREIFLCNGHGTKDDICNAGVLGLCCMYDIVRSNCLQTQNDTRRLLGCHLHHILGSLITRNGLLQGWWRATNKAHMSLVFLQEERTKVTVHMQHTSTGGHPPNNVMYYKWCFICTVAVIGIWWLATAFCTALHASQMYSVEALTMWRHCTEFIEKLAIRGHSNGNNFKTEMGSSSPRTVSIKTGYKQLCGFQHRQVYSVLSYAAAWKLQNNLLLWMGSIRLIEDHREPRAQYLSYKQWLLSISNTEFSKHASYLSSAGLHTCTG